MKYANELCGQRGVEMWEGERFVARGMVRLPASCNTYAQLHIHRQYIRAHTAAGSTHAKTARKKLVRSGFPIDYKKK